MSWKSGTHVLVFGKSMYAGQKGTVVRDDGPYIMLLANDPGYVYAHRNTIDDDYPNSPNRYFWVDRLCLKEINETG